MLFTITGVVPSVYVMDQGWLPVRFIVIVVEVPLQIVAVPLMLAVGRGLTIMVVVDVLTVPQEPLVIAQ